jgi:hypothetical protein
MADPSRVSDLLDRAASGPVREPDVGELLRRGLARQQRQRLTQIGAVMTVAAALVVGIGLVAQNSHAGNYSAPELPAVPVQRGPTASQIAHGRWHSIPAPPGKVCTDINQAAWDGVGVVVLSTQQGCRTPLAYDPKTNRWHQLAALPSRLSGDLSVADSSNGLVVLASNGHGAIQTSTGWSSLQTLPVGTPAYVEPHVTAVAGRIFAFQFGSDGSEVAELSGHRWRHLPNLPLPVPKVKPGWQYGGREVDGVAAADYDGSLYLVENASWGEHRKKGRGTEGEEDFATTLQRLSGGSWQQVIKLGRTGLVPSSLTVADSALFAVGGICEPGTSCPPSLGPIIERLTPFGHGQRSTAISSAPGTDQAFDVISSPNALIAYYRNYVHGTTITMHGGETRVYDLRSGQWLVGPTTPHGGDVNSETWTPYGLVVLNSTGGRLLVPAHG